MNGAPDKASIRIRVFDGTRQSFPLNQILVRVIDGREKRLIEDFFDKPEIVIRDIAPEDNFADNYTIIVTRGGYRDSGFFPVKIASSAVSAVDVMLIPKKTKYNFAAASWDALKNSAKRNERQVWQLLAAGIPEAEAKAHYESLTSSKPQSVAALLNITTAMSQILLPKGTPLDYLKELKWDDSLAQDRFFAYGDPELLNQTRLAWQQGKFAPEHGSSAFHSGATASYKQV
jgi:hypothetical protein